MADSGKIFIAVVGEFQMGKSSLINCLGGRKNGKLAPVGDGETSQTDRCDDYELSNDIVLIDTPGINDTTERNREAENAIQRAHCIIFVSDNLKSPKDLYADWVAKAKVQDKPCLFVCNCQTRATNRKKSWAPTSDVNKEFCSQVQDGFIIKNGFDMFMSIDGCLVLPVNVCWAQYAMGVLDDEARVADIRDMCPCAESNDEVWVHSNVRILGDFISNIRLGLLAHYLRHRDKLMTRIADRFCDEFTKRLAAKESA